MHILHNIYTDCLLLSIEFMQNVVINSKEMVEGT